MSGQQMTAHDWSRIVARAQEAHWLRRWARMQRGYGDAVSAARLDRKAERAEAAVLQLAAGMRRRGCGAGGDGGCVMRRTYSCLAMARRHPRLFASMTQPGHGPSGAGPVEIPGSAAHAYHWPQVGRHPGSAE